mgnify:CR=1 FL=1
MTKVPSKQLQSCDRLATAEGIASGVPLLFGHEIKMLPKSKRSIYDDAVGFFRLAGKSLPSDLCCFQGRGGMRTLSALHGRKARGESE